MLGVYCVFWLSFFSAVVLFLGNSALSYNFLGL